MRAVSVACTDEYWFMAEYIRHSGSVQCCCLTFCDKTTLLCTRATVTLSLHSPPCACPLAWHAGAAGVDHSARGRA